MLAIRMQRTGRSRHTQFRVVVQDSRFSASSGRVVAYLGSYDPHSKAVTLNKEKAEGYLKNGAQPSDRVVKLLKDQGVPLPSWVKDPNPKERSIRNPEKLRRNQPAPEAATEEVTETAADDVPADVPATEEPATVAPDETPVEDAPEAPAEEASPETTTEATE